MPEHEVDLPKARLTLPEKEEIPLQTPVLGEERNSSSQTEGIGDLKAELAAWDARVKKETGQAVQRSTLNAQFPIETIASHGGRRS